MKDFIERCKVVYEHIADEESRFIFSNRLLYSATGDYKYIKSIVLSTEMGQKIFELLKKSANNHDNMVIDGAGEYGRFIYQDYPELPWVCFSDASPKEKTLFDNIPVLQRKQAMEKYPNAVWVISSTRYFKEIEKELVEGGIDQRNIVNVGKIVYESYSAMYFDVPYIQPKKNNCLIDGGAYHGESTIEFYRWCGENGAQAVVFEPDKDNYNICKHNLAKMKGTYVLNKGTYDAIGEQAFSSKGNMVSQMDPQGREKIETTTIDSVPEAQNATYIKLDVEGVELETLKGGAHVIGRNKPDMAISVYHKPEDIVELLECVLSINPNYVFYLRHYTLGDGDTVAFATIR